MTGPKKVLIERIAIAVLVVIFAAVLMHSRKRGRAPAGRGAGLQKAEASAFNLGAARTRVKAMAMRPETAYKPEAARDPLEMPAEVASLDRRQMKPGKAGEPKKAADEALVLEGLIIDEKEPLAIISGNVVGVGDIVSGAKVVTIEREGVVLLKDGSKIRLKR